MERIPEGGGRRVKELLFLGFFLVAFSSAECCLSCYLYDRQRLLSAVFLVIGLVSYVVGIAAVIAGAFIDGSPITF